jgi:gamma-glutamyltranspeptidase/glutathione hydrolase
VGEVVRLTALATTLATLAADGPDAAYTGSLAERAAIYLESEGSPLRLEDFRSNHSDWAEPIATDYRGVTALSHPPNSCGPIALGMLNVLAALRPPKADAFTDDGVTDVGWVHAGLEAARLALADRDAFLTDPDAMTPGALTQLLSREEASRRAAAIDPGRVAPAQPSSLPAGGGTIYLTTADHWGGLVSLIESNYAGFGSGLTDPQTGINYQNRGAFFRLDPSHVNALTPRKRTVHTLTPGMLLRDGKPWIAHGSMGGEIQPQVFAQFVSAVVDGGVDIASAISAPRWAAEMKGHLGPPSTSLLESRYDARVIDKLRELGHDVELAESFDSGLGHEHAIEIVRDPANPQMSPTFAAAADPRSEGLPGAL